MRKGIGFVVELMATIVLMILVYYFVYVIDNRYLAIISLIFGIAIIFGLRHIMRKSGVRVYQNNFKGSRVNTLTTEGRIMMAVAIGFFFAGIILVIITIIIGPLQTYVRIPFFVICWVVGALIGDTLKKVLQNTKMAF